MTPAELNTIIQSVLCLILLAFIMLSWWPNQRVDLFRQQMFALRDELFDFALAGKIRFDDPAYGLLRGLMNGMIRYAHNLTPYRTGMSYLQFTCAPREERSINWSASWQAALENVDSKETRDALEAFHSRASMLVVSQLVLSPGLLMVALPLLAIVVVIYAPWSTLRDIYAYVRGTVPLAMLEEQAANS